MSILVGNWKMGGSFPLMEQTWELWQKFEGGRKGHSLVVLPPSPFLSSFHREFFSKKASGISLGAQDCSSQEKGAFTGEVACSLLREIGCEWVLLGHDERRTHCGETGDTLEKKFKLCKKNRLKTILCIGESKEDFHLSQGFFLEKGSPLLHDLIDLAFQAPSQKPDFFLEKARGFLKYHPTFAVVVRFLEQMRPLFQPGGSLCFPTALAYEPIWAIGGGAPPSYSTLCQRLELLQAILQLLQKRSKDPEPYLLYGGSVNQETIPLFFPKNLPQGLFQGFLLGRAALDPQALQAILSQLPQPTSP